MSDEDETFAGAYWSVQPRWLRRAAYIIVLPAWLVLGAGIITGRFTRAGTEIPVAIIALVGLTQVVFIAKAYWRMKI